MNLKDLKVGDTVFVAAENPQKENHYKGIISKVGRKYITVIKDGWANYSLEFHIDSGYEKSNVSPEFKVYKSEQDYKDYLKYIKLKHELSYYISKSKNISLNILLEIQKLLNVNIIKD